MLPILAKSCSSHPSSLLPPSYLPFSPLCILLPPLSLPLSLPPSFPLPPSLSPPLSLSPFPVLSLPASHSLTELILHLHKYANTYTCVGYSHNRQQRNTFYNRHNKCNLLIHVIL